MLIQPGDPHFFVDDESVDLPADLVVLEGERVLSLEKVPFHVPEQRPTLESLISAMCGIDSLDDVASAHMPIASKAFDESIGEGLYEAEFARDALVMSDFAFPFLPEITRATVLRLAYLQGVRDDEWEDNPAFDREELGRIPHEMRSEEDPLAAVLTAQFDWDWPYFGSVDSTPLFASAVVRVALDDPSFLDETVKQRDGVTRSMLEILNRAVIWMLENVAANPFGFITSLPATNGAWQVWADSTDAYHDEAGAIPRGELAAIEVQALAFDALNEVALMFSSMTNEDLVPAPLLRDAALRMRESVLTMMWQEEKNGYFAYGYIFNPRGASGPLTVLAANSAMVLRSAMLDDPRYRELVELLAAQVTDQARPLVCPSGIRTLAEGETRFRAHGYHTGTVWPWQNYWIADGLRRHGFEKDAAAIEQLMTRVNDAQNCYPEYVKGSNDGFAEPNECSVMVRSPDGHGGSYIHGVMQPAQKFQGWTVFGAYAVAQRSPTGERTY